jgi:predicted transposase YbfD/YdcC
MSLSIKEAFSSLEDPRVERNKRHDLQDIIVLSICGITSGAEGWEAIEAFGKEKETWLREWLELENGIPSHDCIARVISRIPTKQMSGCFIKWTQSISEITQGEIVSVDGKTARHSFNSKDKLAAIHMVSAWANQARISLGQVKTAEKSNEITAIPELLKMLELKGCIVTIDAMGCQTEIAEKIVEKQADYVLAVKANQKHLHEAVMDYFEEAIANGNAKLCQMQQYKEVDAGHGRIEIRRCYLSTCLDTLPNPSRWAGIKSIGMVESERHINGKTSIERRHFISTLTQVKSFGAAVRKHWEIENSLHWVLDVTFREDESRIRTGFAHANFNIFRQLAINLLKRESSHSSIKRKRFKATLSDAFRKTVIFSS